MTGTTVASPEAAAADDAAFADLLSGDEEAAAAALTPPGDPIAAGASPKEMPNGMSVADSSPTWVDNMTPQIIAAVEVATAPLVGSPPAAFSQREKKEEAQGEKEEALVVVPPEAAATAPPTHPPAKKAILEPLRRSSRSAALADEHTLLKAERLTAKRNLETPGNSFSSLPDSHIISNFSRIGINLRSSDVFIKNIEIDRLTLSANNKKKLSTGHKCALESDDELETRLEDILSHTCGNLNENTLDLEMDQIIDLSPVRRKKKYNNAKNNINGKLPKKPKTPSKLILK
ncbi:hypothetical protein BS78_05G211900 [Paspalum vaginatum]|nr:hypothetical protein BS78_05G211900 [Paspalum vaginatum]